jgi:hypothetical protein
MLLSVCGDTSWVLEPAVTKLNTLALLGGAVLHLNEFMSSFGDSAMFMNNVAVHIQHI